MKFNYSQGTIDQGRHNQLRTQEVPASFGSANGVVEEPRRRMAGDKMAEFKNQSQGSDFRENMEQWNSQFSMSNEGAVFNQAKMNGGQLPGEEESYYA